MSKSNKVNILVAFPYFSQGIYQALREKDPSSFRLIVDSGAFTAWNTGKTIHLEEYCKFLKTIPSDWDYKAVQLDVYGDPKKTYENYLRMLDMGFDKIMPVFTRGDTLEQLEKLYTFTDYIMFGGVAIGSQNQNYVKWFLSNNKGRKAHWLGFVQMPFIKHYKPFSVDSSSIYSAERYGTLQYYCGGGTLKSILRTECSKRPPDTVIHNLKKCGFTIDEILGLQKQDAWWGAAEVPNSSLKGRASFMTVTSHVRRGLDVEENLGTRMYLALLRKDTIHTVMKALNFLKDRQVIK